jgi:hypothetical protein
LIYYQNFKKKIRTNKNQAVNLQTNKRKMRQRTRFFLVVLLLMFAGNIFAQINLGIKSYPYVKDKNTFTVCDSILPLNFGSAKFKKIIIVPENRCDFDCWGNPLRPTPLFNLLTPIAKDFSTTQLGVVCKKEFQFEKKTSIPLRLRIGSLDYTNYMEQKPNALKPQ